MAEKKHPVWIRFGSEIRRLRKQEGLTATQLGKEVSLSPAMISAIERGSRTPKRDRVEAFDRFFATEGAVLRKWSEATNLEADPDWFREVVRSEEQAAEIRMWHPSLVPGLLQTPDYARAVFAAGRPLDGKSEIDQLVIAREQRVEQLVREGGPALWAIVDETVVRRTVGDSKTMKEQLAHLASMAEAGSVKLSVVPTATHFHPGLSGPFRLLSFDGRPSLVYAEHSGGGQLIEGTIEVRRHVAVLEELRGWSLTPTQSVELIKEAGKS